VFTGIVEEVGRVIDVGARDGLVALRVVSDRVRQHLGLGGSVAVDGCCQTVTALDHESFTVEVMAVTRERTTLGGLEPGTPVNLEAPLRAGDPLGGHMVLGHVDDVGEVVSVRAHEGDHRVRVRVPRELARYCAARGSVAVDGVSLTVAEAHDDGFTVALKLDEFNNTSYEGVTAENFRGIDVAADFSIPAAVVENVERISALGVNIVVGTTGWTEHVDRVKAAVRRNGIGLVWSPNYSIGVNVFARVVAETARLLAKEPEYGAWAWEIHHATKKDAPSGTLLKLIDEMTRAGYSRAIDVSSNRAGAHPGTHEIGFDSAADTITLRHVARGREGFARGALKAAQWVVGKKGFHEFREILFS